MIHECARRDRLMQLFFDFSEHQKPTKVQKKNMVHLHYKELSSLLVHHTRDSALMLEPLISRYR
jgi:hypothetical protein